MILIELLLLFAGVAYLIYKWSTSTFNTFTERGLPHQKPYPMVGNALTFMQNKESLHKRMINLYRETKQHKVIGFYMFRQPIFVIQDPEVIKQIGVKDFDAFTNHQPVFSEKEHPVVLGMLTVMKDQRWRDMRNTVSPIFTGAKMRAMFTLMNECFAESIQHMTDRAKAAGDGNSFEIELKDCFSRLSNDLIASTAFGLKINSYENKDNEFYRIGSAITRARGVQAVKFLMRNLAPRIYDLLGIQLFDKAGNDYFMRLVVEAMKYRTEHNVVRPDMIHLLMEAKRESAQQWSDEEIVSQCFIFFFAAFENNANLLCLACYELMQNPQVQERLYEEVCELHKDLGDKTLDYDALKRLTYLDMVVSETLRKWSLAAITDRECGRDYTVKDDDGKVLVELKQGDRLWLQVIGLHWDEEHFEQPEVFDPERFSEENKHKIKPFTYLPFGVGPRICIGNRYALMQAKAMLYYMVLKFKIGRSEKNCGNLMDESRGFQLMPTNGFWFTLQQR